MENITVSQIIAGVTALSSFIAGAIAIYKYLCSFLVKQIEESLKPLSAKVDNISENMHDMDLNRCKDFLVRFISDLEQEQTVSDIELERFHETYAHYQRIGGNSYIHDKVEKLKKQGRL